METGSMRASRGMGAGLLLLFASLAALLAWRDGGLDAGAMTAGARSFAALHPALAATVFSLAYVFVAALAIPVVAAMTVAAGALFGPWLGAPLAVVSSAAGATIAMLVVRYALRDRFAARFPKLSGRLEGPRDGAAVLFAARMTPLLPFALVNAAAGVSGMPARTFALVSAAGAAPLACLYVSAGAALAGAGKPADVLSPRLGVLLALAGAAPLAARCLGARFGRRVRPPRRHV